MLALVACTYFPLPQSPDDNTLFGLDFLQLHLRRITFATQALAEHGHLPGWYPRELMGTPFWSNVQNFPFIPTRLLVLATTDPLGVYAAAVQLAALLSALFTFLWMRRLGLGVVGSAVAGWTFAAAGYFAGRIMPGHLPLLEAYPALPLLLWRVDACLDGARRGFRAASALGALALATLCVVLAGHPQVPAYSCAVAAAYLLYRARARLAVAARPAAAMVLGAGCGAFSLWPMFELIRRSTRVLPLERAANDIAFPYERLRAFVMPWGDGWPQIPLLAKGPPPSYPNDAVFWDTVCYVGLMPLAAVAFIAWRWWFGGGAAAVVAAAAGQMDDATRERRRDAGVVLAVAGVVALVTALTWIERLGLPVAGTFLRSPARQLYVTTFALAVAAGWAVDLLVRAGRQPPRRGRALPFAVAGIVIAAHVVDLGRHARTFVRMCPFGPTLEPAVAEDVRGRVGDGRSAIDYNLMDPLNRQLDDVGFFDSIMLAKPYATLMDLAGAPAGHNVQDFNGSALSRRALAATGVRFMWTFDGRDDLELLGADLPPRLYAVPDGQPRAAFFPASAALAVDEAELRRRLRDETHDLTKQVMLPLGAPGVATAAGTRGPSPSGVAYERPSPDEIVLRVRASEAGFVRVLESWDPGWRAALPVLCADGAFMAIPLPAGEHVVHLSYRTPGLATGVAVSLVSLLLLVALTLWPARGRSA